MKTKHTQGSWVADGLMVTLAISETFPRIVKIAYAMAENMAPSERLANAALIAAAPDLLAALQFARRILGANECGTDDVLAPIDDAIAKAKG